MSRLLILLIRGYKRMVSPLLGSRCRFHPSCSEYAITAIARFGALRGSWLAFWRLLRCQPLCDGGLDPVPLQFRLRPVRCRHAEHEDAQP